MIDRATVVMIYNRTIEYWRGSKRQYRKGCVIGSMRKQKKCDRYVVLERFVDRSR